jgi:hypothetical protein
MEKVKISLFLTFILRRLFRNVRITVSLILPVTITVKLPKKAWQDVRARTSLKKQFQGTHTLSGLKSFQFFPESSLQCNWPVLVIPVRVTG